MCPDTDNGAKQSTFKSQITNGQRDGDLVGRGEVAKDATDNGETGERGNE